MGTTASSVVAELEKNQACGGRNRQKGYGASDRNGERAASDGPSRRATPPRQKRWPWEPPAPPATARETVGNGAWAAGSIPAARRGAVDNENREWDGRKWNPPAVFRLAGFRRQLEQHSAQGHGNHGDGNHGCLVEHEVVKIERRVGMTGKQPTVFDHVSQGRSGLAECRPSAAPMRREAGRQRTGPFQERQDTAARSTGAQDFDSSAAASATAAKQIAGHHAYRSIREPCARNNQGQGRCGTIERAPPTEPAGLPSRRAAKAAERNPEAARSIPQRRHARRRQNNV